jgi:hypothetical protein
MGLPLLDLIAQDTAAARKAEWEASLARALPPRLVDLGWEMAGCPAPGLVYALLWSKQFRGWQGAPMVISTRRFKSFHEAANEAHWLSYVLGLYAPEEVRQIERGRTVQRLARYLTVLDAWVRESHYSSSIAAGWDWYEEDGQTMYGPTTGMRTRGVMTGVILCFSLGMNEWALLPGRQPFQEEDEDGE